MTETEQNSSQDQFAGLLAAARDGVEAGKYDEALASVRDAKSVQPRNVYVLAFERQVEQLIELHAAGKLGEEERVDIVESIPGIVDRALEGAGLQPLPATPAPDASAAERARAERAAAHEWLKNQYFQHAHEYVKRGEYGNALAEIRRVFIIDPGNQIARDFEAQIDELSRIQKASGGSPPAPKHATTGPAPQAAEPRKAAAAHTAAIAPQTAESSPAERKKLRPLSIILLFLALALLAFATVFLIRKLEPSAPKTPRSTISSPEREVFTPEQTPPPADTARARPATSPPD